MRKETKLIIAGASAVILILVLIAVLRSLHINQLREKIPQVPDLRETNPELRDQLTSSRSRALKTPSAGNLGILGMVFNSSEFYNEAATCYRLAAERDENSWQWDYYCGYIELEMGNPRSALAHFNRVSKKQPENYMVLYYSAIASKKVNSPDTALVLFSKIMDVPDRYFRQLKTTRTNFFPLKVYAGYEMARIYSDTGNPETAKALLEEINRSFPDFSPAFRQLAELYSVSGDSSLAARYTNRANDLITYVPPADTLIDRLDLLTRSETYLMKRIDLAIRSANSQYATDLLANGIRYFSDSKMFLSQMVKQYLRAGIGDNILSILPRHLDFFKDDFNELFEVGRLLLNAGYKEQGVRYLLAASVHVTEKPGLLSQVAVLLSENTSGDYPARLMNNLVEANPGNTDIMADAIYLSLVLKDRNRALLFLNKIRNTDPLNPRIRFLEGIIAEYDGKTDLTIRLFEEAFLNYKQNRILIDKLNTYYLRNRMWAKAITFLNEALDCFPNDSDLQERLGGLLTACPEKHLRNLKMGRELSERAYYNYIYSINTKISAGRNLAIAYNEMGEKENALRIISGTIELARSIKATDEYLADLEGLARDFSSNYPK